LNGVYTGGNAKEVLEAAEQVLEEYQKKTVTEVKD